MALDITKSVEIIELMENYISFIRPEPEIRKQLDINYEINDQSVILNRIRPSWDNPDKLMTLGYAKATYVQSKHVWKLFWKRADNQWHSYKPQPTVNELEDFIECVDEDKYGCFSG